MRDFGRVTIQCGFSSIAVDLICHSQTVDLYHSKRLVLVNITIPSDLNIRKAFFQSFPMGRFRHRQLPRKFHTGRSLPIPLRHNQSLMIRIQHWLRMRNLVTFDARDLKEEFTA